MHPRRTLLTGLAIALAATAAVAPSSVAAKRPPVKKYCNLVTDPAGDANMGAYSFVESDALDILGADIATGKNELVAVLRLKSTNLANDTWNQFFSYDWSLTTTLNGFQYGFTYEVPSTKLASTRKPSWEFRVGKDVVPSTFAIEGDSLVWRVDRKLLPSLNKKPGQRFTSFGASSDVSGTKDTATGTPAVFYPDKAPSCVRAR